MYRQCADFNMKCSFFWAFFLVRHCLSLIDMNLHELQYVSDHLTYQECRQLSAALRLKTWNLPENIAVNGEPAAPCLILLLRYDMDQGQGMTYHDLARRIRQIGRADLAKRLSYMVLHKKAEAIQNDFLDDPFQKDIGITSVLLDNSPESDGDDIEGKDEDDGNNTDKNEDDSDNTNEDEDDNITEDVKENESSKSPIEWLVGSSKTDIALIYIALFIIFLLLMTFCIFGCPQSIKNCCKCCAPHPLVECINDVSAFIRVDLVGYLREVCKKQSALEDEAELKMREKMLSP